MKHSSSTSFRFQIYRRGHCQPDQAHSANLLVCHPVRLFWLMTSTKRHWTWTSRSLCWKQALAEEEFPSTIPRFFLVHHFNSTFIEHSSLPHRMATSQSRQLCCSQETHRSYQSIIWGEILNRILFHLGFDTKFLTDPVTSRRFTNPNSQ